MQNLTKEWKQPPIVILPQPIFYNVFIQCLWLRIIRRSDQGVQFMNFPSGILFDNINHGYRAAILKKNLLWLLPFYMVVATFVRFMIYVVNYVELYDGSCALICNPCIAPFCNSHCFNFLLELPNKFQNIKHFWVVLINFKEIK